MRSLNITYDYVTKGLNVDVSKIKERGEVECYWITHK